MQGQQLHGNRYCSRNVFWKPCQIYWKVVVFEGIDFSKALQTVVLSNDPEQGSDS